MIAVDYLNRLLGFKTHGFSIFALLKFISCMYVRIFALDSSPVWSFMVCFMLWISLKCGVLWRGILSLYVVFFFKLCMIIFFSYVFFNFSLWLIYLLLIKFMQMIRVLDHLRDLVFRSIILWKVLDDNEWVSVARASRVCICITHF